MPVAFNCILMGHQTAIIVISIPYAQIIPDHHGQMQKNHSRFFGMKRLITDIEQRDPADPSKSGNQLLTGWAFLIKSVHQICQWADFPRGGFTGIHIRVDPSYSDPEA